MVRLGLLLGCFVFLALGAFGSGTSGDAFLTGVNVTRWLYIICATVGGIVAALFLFGLTGVFGLSGAAAGHEGSGGNLATTLATGLVGAGIGSGVSLLILGTFLLKWGLLIGGTTLLLQAGQPGISVMDFNFGRLILGLLMIFFSVLFFSRSKSRSS